MFNFKNKLLAFFLVASTLLTTNNCNFISCTTSDSKTENYPCQEKKSNSCDNFSCQTQKVGLIQNSLLTDSNKIISNFLSKNEISFNLGSNSYFISPPVYHNQLEVLLEHEPINIYAPNSPPIITL